MKIIQVIPFLGMGGAEIMCENLVRELQRSGHKVIVISLYNKETIISERLKNAAVDIRFLDKKQGLDISMFKKLKKIFIEEKPDVIHTHLYVTKYVFPIASSLKIKVVHTFHSIAAKENGKIGRKINKYFFKRKNVIPIALSDLVRDSVVEEYKIEKDKIPVVFNGIDLSKCVPKSDYSVTGNFKILHIGRFSEPKNHIGMLKAFGMFHDRHPDSELWLVGDGEKRSEIERCINENNLSSSVKLLGLQSNVYGFLHDADIFTLPSVYEGMPMTLIEAMGTGLPIVATAVGGIPDMLNENCAQLVAVDENEISAAYEKYYNDCNLRMTHGKSAAEEAKRFSVETMAKEYCKIYE